MMPGSHSSRRTLTGERTELSHTANPGTGHTRAAACHSLMTRLPGKPDVTAVRQHLALAAGRWSWLTGIPVWESHQPWPSSHERAGVLAQREAVRPVDASRRLRIVLVTYADSAADLVLVADRSCVPPKALAGLRALLLEGQYLDLKEAQHEELPQPAQRQQELPDHPKEPPGQWGLGDPARWGTCGQVEHELTLSCQQDGRILLAAAATLVWSRYSREEVIAAGLAVDEGHTVAEFLRSQACAPSQLVTSQPVSVWWEEAFPGCSYRPCLVPVSPITLCGERQLDGRTVVTCWWNEGAVAEGVARLFTRQVVDTAARLAASQPADRVSDIPVLSEEETWQVLRLGGLGRAGRTPRAAGRTIDECFRDVAARQPQAVAVTDGQSSLTYRELDERSERLARGLQALGAAVGDLVGVCAERDATLIVVLLAVLKAGCAYVPMDTRHPENRLRFTAADSGARIVVTEHFPQAEGVRVVGTTELEHLGRTADSRTMEALPEVVTDDERTAYVIYTSGSTGTPKGVMVPHRNVLRLVGATEEDFALGADDTWTMFHSAAFDFSVWEVWGCLLTGGRLAVTPHWATRAAEEFYELLIHEHVTVLSQTPSAFSQLALVDMDADACLAVRLVIFGGEPLDTRMLLPWFRRHSPSACRMVNMFGITETTVHVTKQTVTPEAAVAGSRSVGTALPGWSVSVRDAEGRVLPPGAPGEIWVSGAGVASGYLGRPELTGQRFVVDPVTGERSYRSGDLGRVRTDGTLDHLGRIDDQVKIRGHRVELGEIRSILLKQPGVSTAAVIVRQEVPGDPATVRIHAYAVLDPGGRAEDILAGTRRLLPEYMSPATLTAVEYLPLTVNGKLDVECLPRPVRAGEENAQPPCTEAASDILADKVLGVWRSHLGTEVGPDDNFFELGGNSLQVTRVLADLRKAGLPRVSALQFYRNSSGRQFIELVRGLHEQSVHAPD